MVLDVRVGSEAWRVINVYNDVDDPTALEELLDLDITSSIPTLLVGDFNLHSRTWSTGWQVQG